VDYSRKNQDIEEALHGISLDLRDLEGEIFNIKIWHEINVAPMKVTSKNGSRKLSINSPMKGKKQLRRFL
jgi:hypothetical protein